MSRDKLVSARTLWDGLKAISEKWSKVCEFLPGESGRLVGSVIGDFNGLIKLAEVDATAGVAEHARSVREASIEAADDAPPDIRGIPGLASIPVRYTAGIYFLVSDGVVVYIGQSVNPTWRLLEHERSGKAFDRAYLLPAPPHLLGVIEGVLIRKFRPALNRFVPDSLLEQEDGEILGHLFAGEL